MTTVLRRPPRPSTVTGGFVTNTVANAAMPAASVITGPVLAHALGPHGRGSLAAVLAPLALANLIFTLGFPESLIYHVATKRTSVADALRIGAAIGGCMGLLAWAVLALAAPHLLHGHPDVIPLLQWIGVVLPFSLAWAGVRAVLMGQRLFGLVSRERLTEAALRFTSIVALAGAGVMTPTNAAWATALAGVAASLWLVLGLRGVGRSRGWDRTALRRIAVFSGKVAPGTMSGLLILRLDQSMMVPLTGARQLGYYAVAVSLAEIPATAMLAMREVMFAFSADRGDPDLVARASRMATVITVPCCLAGIALAPIGLPLLFGGAFEPAVPMAQILFVASIPGTMTTIFGAGLLGLGRPVIRSVAQLGGAVLTIALLIVLVPPYGGVGASVASLITYVALTAVFAVAFARLSGLSLRRCLVPGPEDVRDLFTIVMSTRARLQSRRQSLRESDEATAE